MQLILMRHAKSDWSFEQEDHDRPLNPRGRLSAEALGDWLRDQDLTPDQVLCSTSARTRETFDLLKLETQVHFSDALYHAAPETMLDVLKQAQGQRVLMVGHNPGIALFANGLVAAAVAHPRFQDYPTCATLVVKFDISRWSDLTLRSGTAQHFVVPRELINPA